MLTKVLILALMLGTSPAQAAKNSGLGQWLKQVIAAASDDFALLKGEKSPLGYNGTLIAPGAKKCFITIAGEDNKTETAYTCEWEESSLDEWKNLATQTLNSLGWKKGYTDQTNDEEMGRMYLFTLRHSSSGMRVQVLYSPDWDESSAITVTKGKASKASKVVQRTPLRPAS